MSTKSKLLAMTENLQLPPEPGQPALASTASAMPAPPAVLADTAGQAPRFPPVVPGTGARTGPGQMLQFRGQMLAVEGELDALRAQLQAHDGAKPTRNLDPQRVRPSRWANRHPDAFTGPAFMRLKHDIELAGGNVQPIAVRPLNSEPGHYEIVFGHRRHRACSDLGLPVLATIDTAALSDLDLFSAMDRENRERADLSAYEQGAMYRRALDEKLYPSNRRLAEALGVSHTWVANVLQVADLPAPVLDCFGSRLEVQHRHATLIAAALTKHRQVVLARAQALQNQGKRLSASAVVAALVSAPVVAPVAKGNASDNDSPQPIYLVVGGKAVGTWFIDGAGQLTIRFAPGVVAQDNADGITRAVAQALAR